MTNGANSTTQERHELRDRLKEKRRDLSDAASKLRRDREISANEREKEINRINRLRKDISFELGRLNEAAIRARDDDAEVRQLLGSLESAGRELAAARAELKKATASAKQAVAVIGKVDRVLKIFANLAARIASFG